jgi:hypothetical protein
VTADAAGVVSVPVTALGSGAEARVDYAVSASEPAATSGIWMFLGRVASVPTTLTTPPVPPGSTVWVRARGEQLGRRPSAYTTAVSVAVGNTPRVANVALLLDEFGVPTVSWLPNDYALGVRIYYGLHAAGVAVSFPNNLDADAGNLEHEFSSIRVTDGFVFEVSVEPWTGWTGSAVSGSAGLAVLTKINGTLIARPPVVSMEVSQSGSTGALDLTIQDPDRVVTNVEFAEKVDAGAYGSLLTSWDRSTGTPGADSVLTRGEDIPLAAKHTVSVRYVVTYNDGAGAVTIEGAHSFDADQIAEIQSCEISFDANGDVILSVQGDEDCAKLYATVGDGVTPADPTDSTNDYEHVGRNQIKATGVHITQGNDTIVKVVGENSIGTLGPIRFFSRERRVGPFAKDTSDRPVTGTTSETTLETITIPAGLLGLDGGLRFYMRVDALGSPAGTRTLRIKLNSDTFFTTQFPVGEVALFEVLIFNDGAADDQQISGHTLRINVSGPPITGIFATTAEDSTSDMDIVVTGQLSNGADDFSLTLTFVELIGTD